MPSAKSSHARAQRKHAEKLKRRGIPRTDDIARAMLATVRRGVEENLTDDHMIIWRFVAGSTVEELAARGFDREESRRRVRRTLGFDKE